MKQSTKTVLFFLAMVAVLIFFVGAGCVKVEKTAEEITTEAPTETGEIEKVDENWTTSTKRGDIADTPIAGKINSEKVTVANVSITEWEDEYSWTFSNIAPDQTCGVIISNDAVNFSSKVLKEGTFEKKMTDEVEFDDYHAYYHYEQPDGTPMSINVEWSAKIVIKKIDKENNKVTGWAKFDFTDDKTSIEGSFEANLCEY